MYRGKGEYDKKGKDTKGEVKEMNNKKGKVEKVESVREREK